MQAYPRVTIVTPSYNQAAYLEATIQSVLAQDYPNLEYMVVDGGSTDGSVEIIRRYADKLAWWTSEKDQGQADAINKGFARATGEIAAWLNSDDLYLPGALHSAVRHLHADRRRAMVFGDVVSIDAAGETINVMTFGNWGLEALMQFNIISQPGVFLRREALEKAGPLDLSYQFLLDHHLWLRAAQHGEMAYVPERWAAARFHPEAKNLARAAQFGAEAYRIVDWMAAQPVLEAPYRRLRRRIRAGASRIDARYLLDGGQPGPALRSYARSLLAHPAAALPEWRRMLYAAASLLFNVEGLKQRFLRERKKRLNTP
jgi:glycosyltransferase involved in cell wall biosynthesis